MKLDLPRKVARNKEEYQRQTIHIKPMAACCHILMIEFIGSYAEHISDGS